PQSETVWHQADKFEVPRIAFINKMDRIGADVPAVIAQMKSRLATRPALTQLQIGAENDFAGVIDLVEMKELHFSGDENDAPEIADVDAARLDEAKAAREQLVEIVADGDDLIAELYLAGEPVPADTLR